LRFEWTPQFSADVKRLTANEYELFRKVAKDEFSPACDRYLEAPGQPWPRKLRVQRMTGTERVWEMTWSFSGPGGRATFEWVKVEKDVRVRWRRVGGHAIFKNP
jgi:hypothetical protein